MSILPLKYAEHNIVFQEIPDEVTLVLTITGCPYRCKGCHSAYLWQYQGHLLSEELPTLLSKYKDYITCVCFMGGDQNLAELEKWCEEIHKIGLKTALYTGRDDFPPKNEFFDYLKIGHYDSEKGGLNSPTTNQRMFIRTLNFLNETVWQDITYKFRKD